MEFFIFSSWWKHSALFFHNLSFLLLLFLIKRYLWATTLVRSTRLHKMAHKKSLDKKFKYISRRGRRRKKKSRVRYFFATSSRIQRHISVVGNGMKYITLFAVERINFLAKCLYIFMALSLSLSYVFVEYSCDLMLIQQSKLKFEMNCCLKQLQALY